MSTWRRRAALTASGIGVLALVSGMVVVGHASPVGPQQVAAGTRVDVPPAATTLVCPGPVRLPASTGDKAFNPTPVGAVTAVRGATTSITATGQLGDVAATALLTDLASGKELARVSPAGGFVGVAGASGPAGPVVLTAQPVANRSPRVAGTGSSLVTAGDLRGLAAGSCTPPSTEAWLVGGSTELSSTALLTLANAGSTPTSVDLEVWGPNGPAALSGTSALLVAPNSQRQVLMSAIAAEQRRIVVHVHATGGTVGVSLQDNELRGLTPGGLDIVSPGAAPSTRQVVGSIDVPASSIGSPDQAVLRLVAPGNAGTTATILLLGPNGLVLLPGANSVDLAAGTVVDVPLAGIPAGAYTAVVDAGVPVVASAMITRVGTSGALEKQPVIDRAWAASEEPGKGGIVVLPAVSGLLASVKIAAIGTGGVNAGGAARGTLRGIAANGTVVGTKDVSVPAGSTLSVPVSALGDSVVAVDLVTDPATTSGTSGAQLVWWLLAHVVQSDGALLTVLTPVAPEESAAAVEVRLGTKLGLP